MDRQDTYVSILSLVTEINYISTLDNLYGHCINML